LVLGAGYVSAPVVEYLTRDSSVGVTIASALKEEAKAVAQR
jgi:alpha-aminoadipic semialdehyde synthase